MRTLPALCCIVKGGQAVYFGQEQTEVILMITLENFPPDLLIAGDTIPKYTARPPNALSISEPDSCSFTELRRVLSLLCGEGGSDGVLWLNERDPIKRGFSKSKKHLHPGCEGLFPGFHQPWYAAPVFPPMHSLTIRRIHIFRREKTFQNVYNNPGS